MGKILGLVYRALVTHLIRNGYIKLRHTGAVTMTQQFGSAMTAYRIAPAVPW